ncbi:hypothetical protein [Ferrovibrio xuzhouensis]|uniref:Uncharacterized protein n=1 Tax=Ferrovibrio xuzhouensis TaxID=1576914 RepID=A0ABV7VKY6_9PROT
MHLNLSAFCRHTAAAALLAPVLLSGLAVAQQAPADQQKAVQSQPDPHVPPPAQPIDPGKAAARDMQDKALDQMKKQAEPPKPKTGSGSAAAPRNRTMQFSLPPLVAISEVPRGKAVMIQGQVLSPQPTTFVLNDGNSSMVINLGTDWRQLSKVRAGDRVGVIGQMDPYGSPLFRATGIVLDTGRIIVIPNS